MKGPTFSFIIPTLNEEKFLPNLLTSLSDQSSNDFEIIVVDGLSKDNTLAKAAKFAKKLPRLRVIESKIANLPLQRNLGAKAARGKWLVFVDADTVLLPYCLDRLAFYIQEEHPRFITTWGKPDSRLVQDSVFTLLYNMVLEGGLWVRKQLSPGPFTAIERTAFFKVGGYDEKRGFGEDQDISLRLAGANVPLFLLRETLYVWSLRRFRTYGLLRGSQVYILAGLKVLLTGKNYTNIRGYVMGGHAYGKKLPSAGQSALVQFRRRLRIVMKEFMR